MSYGLELRDANNRVIYSPKSATWMLLDAFDLGANQSITKNYINMTGFSEIEVSIIPIDPPLSALTDYTPVYSGEIIGDSATISISPQSEESIFCSVLVLIQ